MLYRVYAYRDSEHESIHAYKSYALCIASSLLSGIVLYSRMPIDHACVDSACSEIMYAYIVFSACIMDSEASGSAAVLSD